jgi:protein-S-isoprenylcysteine O-methyltransferase Ste14
MNAATAGQSPTWIARWPAANLLLFGVTLVELTLIVRQTETFTFVDWIYLSQHLLVLGFALTRRHPEAVDSSLVSDVAVLNSYAYPYAQMVVLGWQAGDPLWPGAGLVLVTLAALLSVASLLAIGRSFGIRPALRRLVTSGPYHFVRHPLYLSYVIADVGYNLQEWTASTVLLVLAGWISLIYRIQAEERVLARDPQWKAYAASVPYRLLPGLW